MDHIITCPICGCRISTEAEQFLHGLLHSPGDRWHEFGNPAKLNALPFALFPMVALAMEAFRDAHTPKQAPRIDADGYGGCLP